MALLTFGHQGRRDPEKSGKTHLDGRQVVSTSFAKVFLNTLILGQNWSLGGGVWPTSSKWLRRRGGARQVQKSVEGVENTILTPGFQSGYISGGLWSSTREPKDSKNLQGFKFETKQKCLTDVFSLNLRLSFAVLKRLWVVVERNLEVSRDPRLLRDEPCQTTHDLQFDSSEEVL